jgi:hypothetical protein
MCYIRFAVPIASLYDNNVKISLRKETANLFYAVTRKYYGVKASPLDEHRDIGVNLDSKMSFPGLNYMLQGESCAIHQIVQEPWMRATIPWL